MISDEQIQQHRKKMTKAALCAVAMALVSFTQCTHAFSVVPIPLLRLIAPANSGTALNDSRFLQRQAQLLLWASTGEEEEEEEEKEKNPYADPNYPDLEFTNYDDPEYSVDQGVTDEYFGTSRRLNTPSSSREKDEQEIEAMREKRRRKNDEYQFETYHANVLRNGDVFKGEWTVYTTSTFLNNNDESETVPKLIKARGVIKVISRGKKVKIPTESLYRVDGERILHEERVATITELKEEGLLDGAGNDGNAIRKNISTAVVGSRYWPENMDSHHFRGQAGNMCVGNGYTVCDAVPLLNNGSDADKDDMSGKDDDGPFVELRSEVGIQYKRMRFRVKLDYRAKGFGPNDKERNGGVGTLSSKHDIVGQSRISYPALHLCYLTVCRETCERWPRYGENRNMDDAANAALFGPPGAPGGLYDPPPVGGNNQASQYILIDLEGGATVLFPHKLDQLPDAHEGKGWVTSLDWTPGRMRFQVDRKVLGGIKLKGLRTLELSEVQGAEADKWRPRDGGQDMRQ